LKKAFLAIVNIHDLDKPVKFYEVRDYNSKEETLEFLPSFITFDPT